MEIAFHFPQDFINFHNTIVLWLLPWWALAPKLVVVNTIHLLGYKKKLFKLTPCWLAPVGEFPHGVPRTHISNSSVANRPLIFFLLVSTEIPKVHTSIKYSETGSYTSQKKSCRRLDVFFINLGSAFNLTSLFYFPFWGSQLSTLLDGIHYSFEPVKKKFCFGN